MARPAGGPSWWRPAFAWNPNHPIEIRSGRYAPSNRRSLRASQNPPRRGGGALPCLADYFVYFGNLRRLGATQHVDWRRTQVAAKASAGPGEAQPPRAFGKGRSGRDCLRPSTSPRIGATAKNPLPGLSVALRVRGHWGAPHGGVFFRGAKVHLREPDMQRLRCPGRPAVSGP